MKKIKNYYQVYVAFLKKGDAAMLLIIRWVLALGFYEPAMNKVKNISGIIEWFESMEMPMPTINAYMATYTELLGVILLFLGLGVRLMGIPLIIVMLVAIKTVHWENGFQAGENGFEIPLYYIIMLLILMVRGSGCISVDYYLSKHFKKSQKKS